VAALSLLGSASAGSAAEPAAQTIRVVSPSSYFSGQALSEFFAAQLSEPFKQHFYASNDAIWVLPLSTSLKSGSNYCFAMLGITEVPAKGKSARIPAVRTSSVVRAATDGALKDEQLRDCMSDALRNATRQFVEDGIDSAIEQLSRSRERGTLKQEPASPDRATLFSTGLSDEGWSNAIGAVPAEFRKTFDYRRLRWVVLTDSFSLKDHVVCFGIGGVGGNGPEGRNPRFPGYWYMDSWEMSPAESRATNAGQQCRDATALEVVKHGLEESWDDKGLLDGFAMTQEAGVPKVANYRKKDPVAAAKTEARQFQSSLKVGSDTHCGLVIEVRRPIAKVQSMIGEVWLKVEQLYPAGKQQCRFVNGVYQDPG
jgi:hypothetical protein